MGLPQPLQRLGLDNRFTEVTNNDEIINIDIGNITLNRNNLYYIAIKWEGTGSCDFYGTDEIQHQLGDSKMLWSSSHNSTGLPFNLGAMNTDIKASYWFAVYGPQTAAFLI